MIFYTPNALIRGFLGDVFIIPFLVYFLKIFIQKRLFLISILVVVLGFSIEIAQYFQVLKKLSIQKNIITTILFGSTFDIYDLIAYILGGIFSYYFAKYFIQSNIDTIEKSD
jgi:hypothetical protein